MIPQVDFCGSSVTRLMLGDNPFIGNSYVPDVYPRSEMYDYYTAENVLKAMYMAEESGINTYIALAECSNFTPHSDMIDADADAAKFCNGNAMFL